MCSQLNKHFEPKITLWLCTTWKKTVKLNLCLSLGKKRRTDGVHEWSDTEGYFRYLFIYDMRIHKCLPSYVPCFFPRNILVSLSLFFGLEKDINMSVTRWVYSFILLQSRIAMFRIGSAPFGLFRLLTWFADEWIVDFLWNLWFFIHWK